jgi:hypothetical protein
VHKQLASQYIVSADAAAAACACSAADEVEEDDDDAATSSDDDSDNADVRIHPGFLQHAQRGSHACGMLLLCMRLLSTAHQKVLGCIP